MTIPTGGLARIRLSFLSSVLPMLAVLGGTKFPRSSAHYRRQCRATWVLSNRHVVVRPDHPSAA